MSFPPGCCLNCGKEFARVRERQKFCSHACKYTYRNRRRAEIAVGVKQYVTGNGIKCPHCHNYITKEAGARFSTRSPE